MILSEIASYAPKFDADFVAEYWDHHVQQTSAGKLGQTNQTMALLQQFSRLHEQYCTDFYFASDTAIETDYLTLERVLKVLAHLAKNVDHDSNQHLTGEIMLFT